MGGRTGPYGGGGGAGMDMGCKGMGKMGVMAMMNGGADIASLVSVAVRMQPGAGEKRTEAQQVKVQQLPPDCTDFDLYKLCSPYGKIAPNGVKCMVNEEGMCTGIGWVDFLDEEYASACVQALNMSGMLWAQTKKPWVDNKQKRYNIFRCCLYSSPARKRRIYRTVACRFLS